MSLDTISFTGNDDKPAVVFIHGLGMDKDIWVNPAKSRILGGMFPLKFLINIKQSDRKSEKVQTLFDDLKLRGYPVITWSQGRPAGPIQSVLPELDEIITLAHSLSEAGVILIGHSRGGLIGRKYLLEKDKSIRSLITISTPHYGTAIARIANYLSPVVSLINPLIPHKEKESGFIAIRRIFEFFKSKALQELLPDSKFFKTLNDGPLDWVQYISVGGTNPTLFKYGNFSFPDIFEKVIPEHLYPDEIKKGRGDGLVSAESSRILWSDEHCEFEFNHANILFDEKVRSTLVEKIEKMI
jgi:pimeloyl-ACP methyl ester carboxylesterase